MHFEFWSSSQSELMPFFCFLVYNGHTLCLSNVISPINVSGKSFWKMLQYMRIWLVVSLPVLYYSILNVLICHYCPSQACSLTPLSSGETFGVKSHSVHRTSSMSCMGLLREMKEKAASCFLFSGDWQGYHDPSERCRSLQESSGDRRSGETLKCQTIHVWSAAGSLSVLVSLQEIWRKSETDTKVIVLVCNLNTPFGLKGCGKNLLIWVKHMYNAVAYFSSRKLLSRNNQYIYIFLSLLFLWLHK